MEENRENKAPATLTKEKSAECYSGITIDTTHDERSDEKQVKDWTCSINNNTNSTPLYNPPQEESTNKE